MKVEPCSVAVSATAIPPVAADGPDGAAGKVLVHTRHVPPIIVARSQVVGDLQKMVGLFVELCSLSVCLYVCLLFCGFVCFDCLFLVPA